MELWTNIVNTVNDVNNENEDFQILETYEINDILHLKDENINKNNKIKIISNKKIQIGFDYYINDLLKSYNHKLKNIKKQFRIDVPRMKIYYNSKKITDVNDFSQLIQNNYIIMLICTQACVGMVYEKLHNIFLKREMRLGDCSNNNKLLIAITGDNILIKKKLQIFVISEDGDPILKNYINIKLKINLKKKEIFFTWGNKKEKKIRL